MAHKIKLVVLLLETGREPENPTKLLPVMALSIQRGRKFVNAVAHGASCFLSLIASAREKVSILKNVLMNILA